MSDLISTSLPNVEELACQGDRCDRHYFGDKGIIPKSVKINLKAFKKLKVINLDLNSLIPSDFERLIIHFKDAADDEEYYSAEKPK